MIKLSTFQKKIAAIAITCLSVCIVLAFAIIVIKLFGAFLAKFSLVVWPLATAAILSIILKPIVDFFNAKMKMSRTLACLTTFILITAAFSGFVVILLPKALNEVAAFAAMIPDMLMRVANYIGEQFPFLKERVAELVERVKSIEITKEGTQATARMIKQSLTTLLSATGTLISIGIAVTAFAVVPIYLFYMLISEHNSIEKIEKNLSFLDANIKRDIVFLVKQFSEILGTFFRGQVLIAFIMGILFGAGFQLAGVKFGFMVGFLIGLINIVPYLGTIIGFLTVIPLAYLQDNGGLILTIIALSIFCAVQLLENYVLTPKIMQNRTGLHPIVIIFSIFFWGTALNGILGMMLAIPLSAFIVVMWKLIKEQYLPLLFSQKNKNDESPELVYDPKK